MTEIDHQVNRAARIHALLCSLGLLLCLLLVHPVAEIGINDDWSYIRSAQLLAQTGHILYNAWATAMLGWQLYLGALFIKLFGFSFTSVRASTLLVSLPGTYLLHRVLFRFGLDAWHATLGTLVVVLSPIFLPIVFSFMSDVPGFFCIVVCLYGCQRALQSTTSRDAIGWLTFAAVSNIAGGTVRQIAWLGVLVLVPATAWLLRRRRHALLTGAVLWAAGLGLIYACTHWFARQPYSIPEESVVRSIDRHVVSRLVRSLIGIALSVLLFCIPVLVAFVPRIFGLPRRQRRLAIVALTALFFAGAGLFVTLVEHGQQLGMMALPWLGNMVTPNGLLRYRNIIGTEPLVLPMWLRLALTFCLLLVTLSSAVFLWFNRRTRAAVTFAGSIVGGRLAVLSWRQTAGVLLPFAIAYVGLLLPRAAFRVIIDRYLPPLVMVVAVLALRYLQEHRTTRGIARAAALCSTITLLAITWFAVAGSHDVFSLGRARNQAAEQIIRAGIPRTAIDGGMEYDGWTQIVDWGYLDEPRLIHPAGAYKPYSVSQDPCVEWFLFLTPAVTPKYALAYEPDTCYKPSGFAAVPYSTWLPPHGQQVYIQKVQ